MKESGLGTPATRAETIETLIRREYIERVGKDLQPTPKGLQVITMLEEHPLTSPELTGDWENKLGDIEHGKGDRDGLHGRDRRVREGDRRADRRARQGEAPPRAGRARPMPALRRRDRRDHPGELKAYGCTSWKSREEAGCGFVIWKRVASRTLTPEVARQLIEEGRTREVLSGFRSRGGKPFRARLVLNDEEKVEFEFPVRAQTSRAGGGGITKSHGLVRGCRTLSRLVRPWKEEGNLPRVRRSDRKSQSQARKDDLTQNQLHELLETDQARARRGRRGAWFRRG